MIKNKKGKKVLIVDDDAAIVEVITIILEESGYEVKGRTQTNDLFSLVHEFSPDLILLDVWLPGLGGPEITKKLKETKQTSHIPIIVISALSGIKEKIIKYGADDFLAKPFEMQNLVKIVSKYIGKPL